MPNDVYSGIILNEKQKKLFFDYLGMQMKLPKIIAQSSVLTIIVSLILVLGVPTGMVTTVTSVGGLLGLIGVTTSVTAFSLAAFLPIILIAAAVLVFGTAAIAGRNRPKLSFKTAQNVIVEELTKHLFLPPLLFIKKRSASFSISSDELKKKIKEQMANIAYKDDYIRYFFNQYGEMTPTELENVLATLNINADRLRNRIQGAGKLYDKDFKPAIYAEKAVALCERLNKDYCDDTNQQAENNKEITHIKTLVNADTSAFIGRTKDVIHSCESSLHKKYIQDYREKTKELFFLPIIWYLKSPNMREYYNPVLQRKMENLGFPTTESDAMVTLYETMSPEDIEKKLTEAIAFAKSYNVNIQTLLKMAYYHCEKESYIYQDKSQADTDLLKILKDSILFPKQSKNASVPATV